MAKKTKADKAEAKENEEKYGKVLKEFPQVGDFKVRLLEVKGKKLLDVREWIETERYTGWTKRGIRLANQKEVAQLAKILTDVELKDAK